MKKKEIATYFTLLLIIFALSTFAGYQSAKSNPKQAKLFLNQFSSEFGFIKLLPPIVIFAIIFLNNSIKAFIAMILGLFFGLAPVFFVFINGYIIGVVVYAVGLRMGLKKVAMMLIPHGIVEIPAIILACSYGLWLGRMFFKRVTGERISIRSCIDTAIHCYMRTVIPMLLIAAFIETYITPHIA
jgi:stage II sporulation protein M